MLNASNVERSHSRHCPELDTLVTHLCDYTGVRKTGVFYQYCSHCAMTNPSKSFEMFIGVESDPGVPEFFDWASKNLSQPLLLVHDINPSGVQFMFHRQGESSAAAYEMTLEQFAHVLYMVHAKTADANRCPVLDESSRVNLSPLATATNPELILSSVLRCPQNPVRHIDTDTLLIREDGKPIFLIEESRDPSKRVRMSLGLSSVFDTYTARIITKDFTYADIDIYDPTDSRKVDSFNTFEAFADKAIMHILDVAGRS